MKCFLFILIAGFHFTEIAAQDDDSTKILVFEDNFSSPLDTANWIIEKQKTGSTARNTFSLLFTESVFLISLLNIKLNLNFVF